MVWSGVEWWSVVWCGVVEGGVVCCPVMWYGVMWCCVVWCGVVWSGCGVVWCGVVWCGVISASSWFTLTSCSMSHRAGFIVYEYSSPDTWIDPVKVRSVDAKGNALNIFTLCLLHVEQIAV